MHQPTTDVNLLVPELDLLAWIDRFLQHYRSQEWSKMHQWLGPRLDALRGQRGWKLNVLAPRGSAKSTLVTLAYILREAVHNREQYIWIVSETNSQAAGQLAHLKAELTANETLAQGYGDAAKRGPLWRVDLVRLKSGVQIEAFGTCQSVRGRRNGPHRPTLIVCDDIQGDKHLESARRRDTTRGWFNAALLKAGTKKTNFINLATALHRDALALELARQPGWQSRRFQAIQQWPDDMGKWAEWESIYTNIDNPLAVQQAQQFFDDNQQAMTAGADLLWPEEEDLYTLMKLRVESGRAAFDREKQCEPSNSDMCEWPPHYFRDLPTFDHWPEGLRAKVLALDPSKGSDARQGDYSAYVMLGVCQDGTLLVEADMARRTTTETVEAGVELCCLFQPDLFGIETNQFQELLAPEFADALQRNGMVRVEPCRLDNRTPKIVRIRRLGPYLSQRRVRFRANSPSTRMLIEQLSDFPRGAHDDGPDAMEMALRLARELMDGKDAVEEMARFTVVSE